MLASPDYNLVQVKRRLAWHYKQYQREQSSTDQQSYAAAEIEARAAKLGLWRDADPMPPWEFRHKRARLENLADQMAGNRSFHLMLTHNLLRAHAHAHEKI